MQATSFLTLAYVFLIGLLFALGTFLAFMPYLTRRQECFAVTVPASASADPYLRRLKRCFTAALLALTVLLSLGACALFTGGIQDDAGLLDTLDWYLIGSDAAVLIAYYALMLLFRRKVQSRKDQMSWAAHEQRSVAVIAEEGVRRVPLAWCWVFAGIIAATFACALVCYPLFPDQVPVRVSADGTVQEWMAKGPAVIAFPIILQAFLAGCFTFALWSINRSKKHVDPTAPATSALAYGLYARAWSLYDLVCGSVMVAVVGASFLLASLELIPLIVVAAVIIVLAVAAVGSALVLSVVYGQAGSRLFSRMKATDAMPEDDDAHWKAGLFYFNPDDAGLFLPERFGIGWTMNWGRPAAWAILGGIIATFAAFAFAVTALI
ncbi:DUF1648 domain-containing protein [Adlercreutzia murintestinalis]|uniref:DUF1648 domain-containing protein n=1 Tax=Adlercreutzia murintestinalis TaxID=2941325 RepID=UPI00203A3D17|nr:DUF5808 domain-containing protein [Adlercreutzia murintestinalis]